MKIENVNLLLDDGLHPGTVVVGDDGRIAELLPATGPCELWLLPGCVDAHVHFREPGLTLKADIASESRAAAAGGVTTVLDMPNVLPTTTTPEALAQKHALFRQHCCVNYGLWYGITSDNIDQALADYGQPDSPQRDAICGFKVFLGSSTGGMLMNDAERLRHLFGHTQRVIGIHSESETRIRANRQRYVAMEAARRGVSPEAIDDLPIDFHPRIRDVEACMETTRMAVELALQTGAQLHVCHLTTAEELAYVMQAAEASHGRITAEACVAHLWFSQKDYARLGTRIKCNPAIKRLQDRDALRRAIGRAPFFTVGTDHAPHLLSDKQGGALRAASGMPSVQYSLLAMLELARQGHLTLAEVGRLMCATPARRFGLTDRDGIRVGNRADLVLVSPHDVTTVTRDSILSKCGWSPFEGTVFSHRILTTWVGGEVVGN